MLEPGEVCLAEKQDVIVIVVMVMVAKKRNSFEFIQITNIF